MEILDFFVGDAGRLIIEFRGRYGTPIDISDCTIRELDVYHRDGTTDVWECTQCLDHNCMMYCMILENEFTIEDVLKVYPYVEWSAGEHYHGKPFVIHINEVG